MNLNDIKIAIKQWENTFFDKHKRKPQKNDFKDAPLDIKEKYKIYKLEKLKKTNIEKDLNNPWNIKFDKYESGKVTNKENNLASEERRNRMKAMKHGPKETLIEIKLPEPEVLLAVLPSEPCKVAVSCIKRPIATTRSFMKKASEINIDSLIKISTQTEAPSLISWERALAADIGTSAVSERNQQIEVSESFNSHINDPVEPAVKKRKVDTPSVGRTKSDNNFVRLNLKHKSFCPKANAKHNKVRGEIRQSKYSGQMSASRKCYNCGESGHYSNKCTKRPTYGPRDERADVKALGFNDLDGVVTISDFRLQNIDIVGQYFHRNSYFEKEETVVDMMPTMDRDDLEDCLKKSLKIFGFSSFRLNQEKVIRRICSGQSTLAVMPTGSGKSLCYQIPAYIYQQVKGTVALIVSPLISLMQDQISNLPGDVKGVALNSTLKYDIKMKLLAEIKNLEYAFVLVSPEALVESNWLTPDRLPPISFVCIDEVHCLSDWSHHFRPSYLRVCKLLRERFSVNCFLGLSATCTSGTITNICKYLRLDPTTEPDCCVRNAPIPDNITISVSQSEDKEYALIQLLQKTPIATSTSILIYCSTREETTEVATLITVKMGKLETLVGKKRLSWTAESYHAGLSLANRAKLQRQFMKGRIRILVATVAFGMGLDKSDLRTVIHFSRPRSFENFVQEIGRVGRDGLPSFGHVLMVSKETLKCGADEELHDLHRHTFANHVEPLVIKQFMRTVLSVVGRCGKGPCRGHVKGIRPSEVAVALNVREETLMTLLCYLELFEDVATIKILPANYRSMKLNCYRGPRQLAEVSHKSLSMSTVLTMKHLSGESELATTRSVTVDMIDLWERFGVEVATLRQEVKALQWATTEDREGTTRYFKSGVACEFTDWHWIVAVRCDLDEGALDTVYTHLSDRLGRLESGTIADMDQLHALLRAHSTSMPQLYAEGKEDSLAENSRGIREGIGRYFDADNRGVVKEKEACAYPKATELDVRNNLRAFITQHKSDNTMSARAIASVFHGINCPLFPAIYWASQKAFWRCAMGVDFLTVMRWANEEMRFLL